MVIARASIAAVAGAGILALGLVIVPPEAHYMKNEVHAVQLSALTLAPASSPGDLLTKFVVAAAQTADTTPPVVTPSLALRSAQDLTDNDAGSGQAAATLGDAPAPSVSGDPLLDAIYGIFSPYLALLNPGVLLLFGPVIVLVFLACPVCAIFNVVSGFIQSVVDAFTPIPATALAATESVESKETAAFSLSAAPDIGDTVPATDTGDTDVPEPESVNESSDAHADANADEDLTPAPEAAEAGDDSTLLDAAASEEEEANETTVDEEGGESITDITEAAEAEEASAAVTIDPVESDGAATKADATDAADPADKSSSTTTVSVGSTSAGDDNTDGDSSESGGGDS